ncbi:Glutamine--tRNA ligase [Capsicum annuum]|nr:Glutamine--tRNA ligase [Capsicum annuum]KAF3652837.1 Glutamine--tRNA ligase [Capsicum annuum]
MQLETAFAYLFASASENLKVHDFEEACGVGVEVSKEDIERAVSEVFEEKRANILEQRYKTNVGELFGHVRKKLPWADSNVVKEVVDLELYKLLGERTTADNEKPVKNKKEKPVKTEVHTEVYFSDRSVLRACSSKDLLEKHMKATGGKVQTCFPPKPNGFLYIGHAKAMFVDFGLTKERGGGCYLRSRMDVKCWWDWYGIRLGRNITPNASDALELALLNLWIILISRIDKDVIYEDYDKHVQVLVEHSVHQIYESCWGIEKLTDTMKLVKQVIDSGKWILVPDHDFIEQMDRFIRKLKLDYSISAVDCGIEGTKPNPCREFDDTNPKVEKKEYIDHIKEIVGWMGWKPFKVQVLSFMFKSDSSGTLFYILCCGESSCSEDVMSDVGFKKLFTFDN